MNDPTVPLKSSCFSWRTVTVESASVLGSLGLLGNMTSLLVLSQKEMRNCFNELLIALNACDGWVGNSVFTICE
jgi:hypothetical protein